VAALEGGKVEPMKAIVQHAYGGADELRFEEIPEPAVGDRQVLVRVVAAGVDRGAYHLMRGDPYIVRLMGTGLRTPKARVPGTNVAGRVDAVGAAVTGFRPGDEVYGTCKGAFAEYAAADADRIAPKPTALGFEEASVLPYPGTVSVQAVRDRARVQPGQSVLIVGASGAVGTIVVQVAKAFGGDVTGVCSASNVDLVRSLGADHVIDYESADLTAGDDRYDVVLDIGGNTPVRRLRRALRPRGTLVIIGGEGGGRLIGGIHRQLGAQLLSPFTRQKLGTLIASEGSDVLRSLTELVEAGEVRPVMGPSFPLADAARAVADLDAGATRGRIVLTT
jgi:NADPH:quinone reductase-like Zn-dependent oxidoreductase